MAMAMATVNVVVDVATVTIVEWLLLASDLPLDLVAVRFFLQSQGYGASIKPQRLALVEWKMQMPH